MRLFLVAASIAILAPVTASPTMPSLDLTGVESYNDCWVPKGQVEAPCTRINECADDEECQWFLIGDVGWRRKCCKISKG